MTGNDMALVPVIVLFYFHFFLLIPDPCVGSLGPGDALNPGTR